MKVYVSDGSSADGDGDGRNGNNGDSDGGVYDDNWVMVLMLTDDGNSD